MLAITFEFLTGVAYLDGRAAGRQGKAEFPPHPDRVFMALVAAWGGGDDVERSALQWLESAGSPSIVASESRDRPTLTVYSPGNDDLQNYDNGERNVDRRASSTVPDSPRVTYAWDSDPPQDIRRSLDGLLTRLVYLGRSESMVCAWLNDSVEAPTWIPVENGDRMLRVPYPGRLADLVAAYEAGIRPMAAAWGGYRQLEAMPSDGGEWSTMWAFEIDGPADLRHTVRLARAVRSCLLAACPDPIPTWVSGHSSDGDRLRGSHVGVVPLANVGHEHGDGRILGIGLAIPSDSDAAERIRCLGSLFADPQPIADAVRVRRVTSEAATLDPDRWCGASRTWGTVTPIACHRWPKGEVAKVVETDIAHAGLPQPEAIEVRTTSPLVGGLFGAPMDSPNRYRTHAVIHWAKPIRGPIAIGAGRYLGMGFCRGMA
jgi:CRISPR-associated protein Csb2